MAHPVISVGGDCFDCVRENINWGKASGRPCAWLLLGCVLFMGVTPSSPLSLL